MEPPSQEMMPANLGVALGVADKELMTPVLGAMDSVHAPLHLLRR